MKISVVVPVYNEERYLDECLKSIQRQTHTDFECVLVDDGSKDRSGQICDEYAAKDERFKVIHKPNGGLVTARKAGINAASSDYVCFVDSDDYIKETFLSEFNTILEKHSPDMVANNYITPFGGSSSNPFFSQKYLGLYENEALAALKEAVIYDKTASGMNLGAVLPSLCLKCIRRDLLLLHYADCDECVSMGEDAMIVFPLTIMCKSIFITCFEGYFYRKNDSSIVNTFSPAHFDDVYRLKVYFERKIPTHRTQIKYYCLNRIYDNVISAGKNLPSRRTFIAFLNDKLENEETDSYKKLKTNTFSFKNKAIIFLIKRRKWTILHLIIKLFS